MGKLELIKRSQICLKQLNEGVHPVTGAFLPNDSVFIDEQVKRYFSFIVRILDEHIELSEKVERLEREKVTKQKFSLTREQSEEIKLSEEPISILAFVKNVNSVIDTDFTEKLSSTLINEWLVERGFFKKTKKKTTINKTVYKPSDLAQNLGIIESDVVDKNSGEVKTVIKLEQRAQLFLLENIENIAKICDS